MNTWVRRSLSAGALTASALMVGGGRAQADPVGSDTAGALNGLEVTAPVQLPINICGVGIGLLGTAEATCESDTAARR